MFKPDPKLIAAGAIVTFALMIITSSLDENTRVTLVALLCLAALAAHRLLK